jgi:nicotinic acid mononucleotide adenylyltransferase
MHKGHIAAIDRSREENDCTILGVCGFDTDRGKDFIPFKTRVKLVRKKFENEPDVIVSEVDDHKIGLTGTFSEDAWRIWCKEFFCLSDTENSAMNMDPFDESKEYTWYMGEQSYIDKLRAIYPHHKFVLLDRGDINISGTAIRTNPLQNAHMIDADFRKYLIETKIM